MGLLRQGEEHAETGSCQHIGDVMWEEKYVVLRQGVNLLECRSNEAVHDLHIKEECYNVK